VQFRALADNMSQFAWMADAQGWIYWYNRRWYDYTGTDFQQMQGWGWKSVHHPEHVDRVVTRIQHSWDTGEPWEDTFPLRGAMGSIDGFYLEHSPSGMNPGTSCGGLAPTPMLPNTLISKKSYDRGRMRFD
jgi:PAS domain S-box-containing protein